MELDQSQIVAPDLFDLLQCRFPIYVLLLRYTQRKMEARFGHLRAHVDGNAA